MERTANKTFIIITISVFSLFFAIVSIIPILGPSLLAYIIGHNEYRSNKLHGITKIHNLAALTVGELIFYIISSLIIYALIIFDDTTSFWRVTIGVFALSYIISILFYLFGRLRGKKKNAKNK